MRIKTLFVFVISFLLASCSDAEFEMADGGRSSIDAYKGQWVLINYWAEWCRPCLDEIPELNKLNKLPNFQVLGYDYDKQTGSALLEKSARLGVEFPLILNDPSVLFALESPSALPATILVDEQGEFAQWLMGPQTVESIIQATEK